MTCFFCVKLQVSLILNKRSMSRGNYILSIWWTIEKKNYGECFVSRNKFIIEFVEKEVVFMCMFYFVLKSIHMEDNKMHYTQSTGWVFLSVWHSYGHLVKGNINWENASFRLACRKVCRPFPCNDLCGRAQTTAGSAIPGQVVLGWLYMIAHWESHGEQATKQCCFAISALITSVLSQQ